MPIIARRSPSKGAVLLLPKQTTRRRGGNYESVLVSPLFFSSRSKPSASPGRSPERSGRIHSATGGKGDTGDLRRMEHCSNSPRCYLPRGNGDPGYSDGPSPENAMLRGAAAATATAAAAAAAVRSLNSQMKIAGNKNDDDASPKQRTGRQGRGANGNERKQFFSGKVEKEESVRKTDWSKETEEERERASSVTSLPRLPSSPSNGDISFGRIASISPPPSSGDPEMSHSKRHSSDNRTCSWSSASRETADSLRRPDVNTTETTRCISKIRDNLTDTVPTDNNRPTALRSNTDALNEDESKQKAFGGRGDVVIPKTNSSFTVETKNYYSDIRIKLKEAEPIFPFSLRSPEVTQMPNGEAPGVSSSSSKEREEDDDESEIPENVTPNWSSYPGPLLNASTAHESEDEEAIGVIGRNTSAIEANVNCADANADTDADADTKATYNELLSADCSVREISTPSTKAGDCQTNKTKTKDSDPERCSYVHLNSAAAAERSAGSDKQLQTSAIFVSNNYKPTNTNKTSNRKSARDDPRRSTERSEAYVIESHSANRRTLTRDSRSSSVSNSPTGRSSDAGSRTERSFAAQNNEPALAAARRTQDSSRPTGGAVNRLFSRQENARTAADRPNRQSSDAIRDGASASANLRWESSATRINDQKTGERFRSSSSSRSPEKTASIERIWQSIEEPRPRLLRRKIRFEPEPVSPSSTSTTVKSSSSSRRCRVSSYDGGVADGVNATPVENGIHRKNTRLEDKTEDEYSLLEIEVPKGGIGLGFCIDGGKDGPYGDRPITVKRLFRGSSDPTPSAANANLCPGDEILSANGRNMTLLSRYVAWNYLKTLPEGTIKLVVRRQH